MQCSSRVKPSSFDSEPDLVGYHGRFPIEMGRRNGGGPSPLTDRTQSPPNGGQFGLESEFLHGFAEPLKCPELPACGLSASAAAGTESANAEASNTAAIFLRIINLPMV
jgi:hypothetical protein